MEKRRRGGRWQWGEAKEGRYEEVWGDLTSSSVGVAAPGRLPRISSSASVPCQCAVQPPERRPNESAAGPVHSCRRQETLARRGCPARGGSRARHEVAAISRLYLAYTSPISRLSLAYISAISRLSLARHEDAADGAALARGAEREEQRPIQQ